MAHMHDIYLQLARKAVFRMLELECPNLLEHDQNRAIAYRGFVRGVCVPCILEA